MNHPMLRTGSRAAASKRSETRTQSRIQKPVRGMHAASTTAGRVRAWTLNEYCEPRRLLCQICRECVQRLNDEVTLSDAALAYTHRVRGEKIALVESDRR